MSIQDRHRSSLLINHYMLSQNESSGNGQRSNDESQYMVIMGSLHIEMALLNVIGDWLDGSGWKFVMTSANVVTEGYAVGVQ